MADVQFSDEQTYARPNVPATHSGFTRLVMKAGLAKDPRQAEYVLVGIAVAAIIVAVAVWVFSSPEGQATPLGPPEQTIIPGENGMPAGNLRDTL